MPNITRGGQMTGLLVYLAGPGRSNEHVEPHLVAGDPAVMAWHSEELLDRRSAARIAGELDHPRCAFGTQVTVAVKDQEGHVKGRRDAHVWHCSLSLRAQEGEVSDELWAQISERFVAGMGFTGADGQAPCRWVALRHGVSKAGNDHVHLVVSLVREDGVKADTWNDRPRAQALAGELERQFGLQVLESREAGLGSRGHKPAEREIADRAGSGTPARDMLARTVRACAAAAGDEAEFVRRVRQAGLRVRPRYAAGQGDVIAGYSVAERPTAGQATVWFGGGRLARDLTLPRLRAGWGDTPERASAALLEWTAAGRNQPAVAAGREVSEPDPMLWSRYTAQVAALRDQLRAVPIEDRATWAHVARETAGAFAAWSLRAESVPGPLAAAAESLARSAQLRASQAQPIRTRLPSASGAALLLASAAHAGRGPVAEAVLLRQLISVARALSEMHAAAGQAQRAAELQTLTRRELALVGESLTATGNAGRAAPDAEAAAAARAARQGQLPARPSASPLPSALRDRSEPERPPGVRERDRDPGVGR